MFSDVEAGGCGERATPRPASRGRDYAINRGLFRALRDQSRTFSRCSVTAEIDAFSDTRMRRELYDFVRGDDLTTR
jgi:hypothetical protein